MERRRFIGMGLATLAVAACDTRKVIAPVRTIVPQATYSDRLPAYEASIEHVRRIQRESLARGELKIPIPAVRGTDMRVYLTFQQEWKAYYFSFEMVRPGTELIVPAPADGKIVTAEQVTPELNELNLAVKDSDFTLQFTFASSGSLLVKKDNEVELSKTLLKTKEGPRFAGREQPSDYIMLLALWNHKKQAYVNLNLGNLIKDPAGQYLAIPSKD